MDRDKFFSMSDAERALHLRNEVTTIQINIPDQVFEGTISKKLEPSNMINCSENDEKHFTCMICRNVL